MAFGLRENTKLWFTSIFDHAAMRSHHPATDNSTTFHFFAPCRDFSQCSVFLAGIPSKLMSIDNATLCLSRIPACNASLLQLDGLTHFALGRS